MAPRNPTSTNIRIGGPRRRVPVLAVLFVLSVGANLWFLTRWVPEPQGAEGDPQLLAGENTPAPAPVPSGAGQDPVATSEAAPTPSEPSPPPAAAPDGTRFVRARITGPVSQAFVDVLGPGEGDRVALTAARLLSWYLKPSSDARKGDEAKVLFRIDGGEMVEVNVVGLQYVSLKMQKTFEAWRYQPTGWGNASWFDGTGKEVPLRLENSPIADYEQITSLIGDGRGHSGMDFKTHVGTEIKNPFEGTVERTNWNWRNNGNCVEVQTPKGKVRFLHMSEIADGIGPGVRVKVGTLLGLTGNTGRSFAPHLHYELQDSAGRVLDPLKVHKTTRRTLDAAELPKFQAERDRLLSQMAMLDVAPPSESSPAPP